jgi:hypothetical protein
MSTSRDGIEAAISPSLAEVGGGRCHRGLTSLCDVSCLPDFVTSLHYTVKEEEHTKLMNKEISQYLLVSLNYHEVGRYLHLEVVHHASDAYHDTLSMLRPWAVHHQQPPRPLHP